MIYHGLSEAKLDLRALRYYSQFVRSMGGQPYWIAERKQLERQRIAFRMCHCLTFAGWWFQTLIIFTPTWENAPIWLIFFRWVETTWNHQPFVSGFMTCCFDVCFVEWFSFSQACSFIFLSMWKKFSAKRDLHRSIKAWIEGTKRAETSWGWRWKKALTKQVLNGYRQRESEYIRIQNTRHKYSTIPEKFSFRLVNKYKWSRIESTQ